MITILEKISDFFDDVLDSDESERFEAVGRNVFSDERCTHHSLENESGSVEVLGVRHNEEFYYLNRQYIWDVLEDKDAVMIEDVNSGGYENNDFYRELVKESSHRGIDVYSSDPYSTALFNLDLALGFGGAFFAYSNLKKMGVDESIFEDVMESGIGSYMAAGSVIGNVFNTATSTENLRKFFNGVHDFRDVCMVSGVYEALERGEEDVALVAGNTHHDSLRFYLENPGGMEIKRKFYRPLELIGDSSLRSIDLYDDKSY